MNAKIALFVALALLSATAVFSSPTFGPRTDYPLSGVPVGLAVADFNQDGAPDIMTVQQGDSSVTLWLNDGLGVLTKAWRLHLSDNGRDVQVGDLNGDRWPDAVVLDKKGATILLGSGGTGFAASEVPLPGYPTCSAIADLNEDGLMDILVGTLQDVMPLLNQGAGSFVWGGYSVYVLNMGRNIAVGDFNEDGHTDAITSEPDGGPFLLLGTGQGTFTRVSLDLGPSRGVAALDLDHDGHLDVVVGADLLFSSILTSARGHGDGTFTVIHRTDVYCCPIPTYVSDFDHNGTPDVLVVTSPLVTIALNDGSGVFSVGSVLPQPMQSAYSRAADLDGDGSKEVITAIAFGDSLTVYKGMDTAAVTPVTAPGSLRLRVGPNPSLGRTRLFLTGVDSEVEVSLFDLSGRVLETQRVPPGEMTAGLVLPKNLKLEAGVYLVRVRSGNRTAMSRIAVIP